MYFGDVFIFIKLNFELPNVCQGLIKVTPMFVKENEGLKFQVSSPSA